MTGMPERSARASSSSKARELTMPWPAMMTGRSAWFISAAALWMFSINSSDRTGSVAAAGVG